MVKMPRRDRWEGYGLYNGHLPISLFTFASLGLLQFHKLSLNLIYCRPHFYYNCLLTSRSFFQYSSHRPRALWFTAKLDTYLFIYFLFYFIYLFIFYVCFLFQTSIRLHKCLTYCSLLQDTVAVICIHEKKDLVKFWGQLHILAPISQSL